MITVLRTHSVSWAESVRIALLGAGIEAILLDQYSPGTLGLESDDQLPDRRLSSA
jgi:hypothetical protein